MVPRLLYDVYVFDTISFALSVTEDKPLQPEKAAFPMLVTLLGMVTDVRPRHSVKARSPMLVTLLGMVTDVRLLHK